MTKKEREQKEEEEKELVRKFFIFLGLGITTPLLIWLVTILVNWASDKGSWFGYVAGAIGFLFCVGVIYYFIKHLLTSKTFIMKGIVVAASLFICIGIMKFFLPYSFIEPVSIASGKGQLFDTKTGLSRKAICPVCGKEFDLGTEHCSEDGTDLVQGDAEKLQKKGLNLTSSPFRKMLQSPGEEGPYVAGNVVATHFVLLKPGQKLKIWATGSVADGPTDEDAGPKGTGEIPLMYRDGRRFRCGGSFLSLCVHTGSQDWQYCGTEMPKGTGCTTTNTESSDQRVMFSVNEAVADIRGKFHQEWWGDNSGGFNLRYEIE